jgi:hypothetical protein
LFLKEQLKGIIITSQNVTFYDSARFSFFLFFLTFARAFRQVGPVEHRKVGSSDFTFQTNGPVEHRQENGFQ